MYHQQKVRTNPTQLISWCMFNHQNWWSCGERQAQLQLHRNASEINFPQRKSYSNNLKPVFRCSLIFLLQGEVMTAILTKNSYTSNCRQKNSLKDPPNIDNILWSVITSITTLHYTPLAPPTQPPPFITVPSSSLEAGTKVPSTTEVPCYFQKPGSLLY